MGHLSPSGRPGATRVDLEIAMTELPSNQHITYQLQHRKCGKPSCGTCRDSQGHGPYWYAYWREGTRLRSGYIGKVIPPAIILQLTETASDTILSAMPVQLAKTTSNAHLTPPVEEFSAVAAIA
jgi:hypothetical protein